VRADRRRGFRTHLIEQPGELIAQVARRGGGGVGFGTSGCLLAQPGGDFQGLAGIGEAHLVEVAIFQAIEIAFGGIEDGLGEGVLTRAEGLGASGGIEEGFATDEGFGFSVLLRTVSGLGLEATAPIEVGSPPFDGAQGDADLSGGGGEAALGAQLQVSTEGLEGAVGFAPGMWEERWRVER